MEKRPHRSIIILENTAVMAAREIVYGVMRYASAHPEWKLEILTGHPSEVEESIRICKPDGIISGFTDEPMNPIPVHIRHSTPTVFTCTTPIQDMKAQWSLLTMDDSQIGEAAATLLLRKKPKSFAFLGLRHPMPWERTRWQSYQRTLKESGHRTSAFEHTGDEPINADNETTEIVRWIRSLEKPCGIFAVNDRRAKFLLDACQKDGINVPDQVKVIGVDNDEIVCECATPTLTSIMPDFRQAGCEAAQTLDQLMSGKRVSRKMTIGVKEIVERMSTSDIRGSGNRVGLALEHLRRQAFNGGFSVGKLAQTIGCSTRLLEKDFKHTLGRSIIDELNRMRLEKVMDMLRNTSSDEETIAHASGFNSEAYLRNFFKKRFGMTMRQWRLQRQ